MNLTMQEKKVLLSLQKKEKQSMEELIKSTALPEAGVNRAIAWLQEKSLCTVHEKTREILSLDEEGINYSSSGLPERILLNEIKNGEKTVKGLSGKLGAETVKIGAVWLRKLNAAMIINGTLKITPDGIKLSENTTAHEKIIQLIKENKSIPKEMLSEIESLKKRGRVLKVCEEKRRTVEITEAGRKLKNFSMEEEISVITPELIKNSGWKKAKLRKYNVEAPVPVINPGKKQMYYEFLEEVREKMIAMGFKEMRGNIIQTEFWNFDALFTPQTHPSRSEKDTYYLKSPKQGSLNDKELNEKVKQQHEQSWKYNWEESKARNLILRSHTTCLSAKKLFENRNYPLRYFSINKVFRKDVIDATHLPEFNQLEGIVADESLTLRDLLGTLETFAFEIAGVKEVKFKCGYFPYTEPSVELFAKHPAVGWMELGGAGMFRPEMLEPLDVNVPVIAWGMGVDRLAMFALGIKHIKDLFSQDLKFLQQQA